MELLKLLVDDEGDIVYIGPKGWTFAKDSLEIEETELRELEDGTNFIGEIEEVLYTKGLLNW